MKAQIYNYQEWISETDPKRLFQLFNNLLKESKYTILDSIDYHFQPQGYTCMWLLAESHFALHTFPEENKTYIELSGCNKEMNVSFEKNLKILIKQNSF